MNQNFYEILGVQSDATQSEIKKSYFGLVRKFPPERYPEEFMRIREAYEVLSDEKTRTSYDSTNSLADIIKMFIKEAHECIKEEEYDRAIDLLERVTKEYRRLPVVWSMLGDAYAKNGNTVKALRVFEMLAKEEPQNAGYAGKLADAYLERGWHIKAIDKFKKALKLDEDNISLWLGLADCYEASVNYKELRKTLLEAIATSKRNGWNGIDLFYHLIQLDIKEGNMACFETDLTEMKQVALSNNDKPEDVAWFLVNLAKGISKTEDAQHAELLIRTASELGSGNNEIEEIRKKVNKDIEINREIEKLKKDIRIETNFIDVFEAEFDRCEREDCSNCEFRASAAESAIIVDAAKYKRQALIIIDEYPILYEMKKRLMEDISNPARWKSLQYHNNKRYMKLKKIMPWRFDDEDDAEFVEDFFSEEMDAFFSYQEPVKRDENKVGRNDPCPCGSGKKYKKCCGK